jgi:hypothetical protein
MPLIATEAKRLSNVLKKELWPEDAYCRAVVTVNEATAKEYVPGTVLGVTSAGVWKVCVRTASDGSEVPAGIVMNEYSIAAATATPVLAVVKGPAIVSKLGLILDASFSSDAHKNAAYAAFEALDIQVNDAI